MYISHEVLDQSSSKISKMANCDVTDDPMLPFPQIILLQQKYSSCTWTKILTAVPPLSPFPSHIWIMPILSSSEVQSCLLTNMSHCCRSGLSELGGTKNDSPPIFEIFRRPPPPLFPLHVIVALKVTLQCPFCVETPLALTWVILSG